MNAIQDTNRSRSPENIRLPAADPKLNFSVKDDITLFRMLSVNKQAPLEIIDSEPKPSTLSFPELAIAGEILFAKAEIEAAKKWCSDAIKAGHDSSDYAKALRTRILLSEDSLEEAKNTFKTIQKPAAFYATKAALSLAMGQTAEANEDINQAFLHNAAGVVEYQIKALIEHANHHFDSAQQHLIAVCNAVKSHVLARIQLGLILQQSGDTARAGTLFEQAIVLAPAYAPAGLALATMFHSNQNFGEALHIIEGVLTAHPHILKAHILRCRIMLSLADLPQALLFLRDSQKQFGVEHFDLNILEAECYIQSGENKKARKLLLDLEKKVTDTQKVNVYRLLAQLELNFPSKITKAIPFLEKGHKIAPNDLNLSLDLVELYYAAQKTKKAKSLLIAIQTNSAIELQLLLNAMVLAQNYKDYASSKMLATTALELVKDSPLAAQIEDFIQNLDFQSTP